MVGDGEGRLEKRSSLKRRGTHLTVAPAPTPKQTDEAASTHGTIHARGGAAGALAAGSRPPAVPPPLAWIASEAVLASSA